MLFFTHLMRVCCLIVLFQVVAAANIELGTTTRSNSTVSSRFMPSSLPLYPLDFQDNWQASRPIPVDVNFSVPNFGPRDLTNYIQEAARSSDLLAKQTNERDWQDRSLENEENRSEVLLPYVRQRIAFAHRH